ncbi:hypothetical protein [Desulfoplanes formicivorans]|uniref:Uncharacterized protein n=1 Tax=Desulfoplanes formicivorans TaxID=1592317 RepID=A0A194AKF5_9BACT|nr:hypothetical protein [Desulfoplanes formicivorans]GAU09194.1 hypothetical protein DPF_1915 [Desulfoplanes formicivorans]
MIPDWPPARLMGRRTLITGEVNTGKTTLTGRWADMLWAYLDTPRLTVVDMAPTIPVNLQKRTGSQGIGGFVTFSSAIPDLVFRNGILPPRLMGLSQEHVLTLARKNQKRIETWFAAVLAAPRPDLLVINDMSIYLQAGRIKNLRAVMQHAHTVIANGYQGQTLGTDELSRTESCAMEKITAIFQNYVRLTHPLTGPWD